MSNSTSVTSSSDLLGSQGRRNHHHQSHDSIEKWAEDSLSASQIRSLDQCASYVSGQAHEETERLACDVNLLQLKLDVVSSELSEHKVRNKQLEAQLHASKTNLQLKQLTDDKSKANQAVLLQRIKDLENELQQAAESEQKKTAQIARLEGRAAVAEGSLKAAQQQISQALTDVQEHRAKEVEELKMNHEKLLQQVQEQHSALVKQLEAGYEEKLADLSKAAGNAEQNLQIERQECKEIKQQLEREQARANAVNELMRHSEELQSQVDKLQHALQEERRRANKIAQSSETALAAEKHLAEVAAQEYRIKQQEASKGNERALRQVRAKLQRTEADLKTAKLQNSQLATRLKELELSLSEKTMQLESTMSEVNYMEHELQALRRGLSDREKTMLEAAEKEFASALDSCKQDLIRTKLQLSEQALLAQRQSSGLNAIVDILAVHADEADSRSRCEGRVQPAADIDKVVAFVEAVNGTVLDFQQQWDLERLEMRQALEGATVNKEQLEEMLHQERQESKRLASKIGHLQSAQQRLLEMEGICVAYEAAQRDLHACQTELAKAAAKAVAAFDESSKWKSKVDALEAQLKQATLVAEASKQEAADIQIAAATKEERLKEMRSAMSAAMEDKSLATSDLNDKLAELQHLEYQLKKCQQQLIQHESFSAGLNQAVQDAMPQFQALLNSVEPDQLAIDHLANNLCDFVKPAVRSLMSWRSSAEDTFDFGLFINAFMQLCRGLQPTADMLEERLKIRKILFSVNCKLKSASRRQTDLLQHGEAGQHYVVDEEHTSSVQLLQELTENVVALIESLAVEKECIESEMMHAADENKLLHKQIESMQCVLASLQSDSNLEQQLTDAMLSWNEAQRHIATLEAKISALEGKNSQLGQRLHHAQQAAEDNNMSTKQNWSGMQDDIARLVQHAEQAQVDADAAVKRLKAEYEEKIDVMGRQLEEHVESRLLAEQAVEDLQQQLKAAKEDVLQEQLEESVAQDHLRTALASAQQGMSRSEAHVALLQRKCLWKWKCRMNVLLGKKAMDASIKATLLKRQNARLKKQQVDVHAKISSLEVIIQKGIQQLKQAKQQSSTWQESASDAQKRVLHLETLLRKVDERKTLVGVERRKAQEAVGRLEQQVLELQSKLETAQHRERMAQADAEQSRQALSKKDQDAEKWRGALYELEVAEAALWDSRATVSRLLQERNNLQQVKDELQCRLEALSSQLQNAQKGHADAIQQVQDLQEAFDRAVTELDITRSSLARRQQKDAEQHTAQCNTDKEHLQQVLAYPVSLRMADAEMQVSQEDINNFMDKIITKEKEQDFQRPHRPLKEEGSLDPSCRATILHDRTPCTPLTSHRANHNCASHMADDASSHEPTPEPGQVADENIDPGQKHLLAETTNAQPTSIAGPAIQPAQVDVEDVKGLVLAVESLQRQLFVKTSRIKELRAALRQQAGVDGIQTEASSAVVQRNDGSADVYVLQQKLHAVTQQLQSTQALVTNLEVQLVEAKEAKAQLQQQLVAAELVGGASVGDVPEWPQLCLDGQHAVHEQILLFKQQLGALERQVEFGKAELTEAVCRADRLAVELAERDALLEALHMQLGSESIARQSTFTQTDDGEDCGAKLALIAQIGSRPCSRADDAPSTVLASGALSSLDRIVGLWKTACETKDQQIQKLQTKLGKTHDALAEAEAAQDALQQQLQDGVVVTKNLEQQLFNANLQLAAAQSQEGNLMNKVEKLEEELNSANAGLEIVKKQKQVADRQYSSLQKQLSIAQAQVQEVKHAAQLKKATRGNAESLRAQLAAARVDVEMARDFAAASKHEIDDLKRQLEHHQKSAAAAASNTTFSCQLNEQLQTVRAAERRILKEAQDLQAHLSLAQQEVAELQQALAGREAQLREALDRLESSDSQLAEAMTALQEQNDAMNAMQQALEQEQHNLAEAQAAFHVNQQTAALLDASQQEAALLQQRLEVAEQQMDILRTQLHTAEEENDRFVAHKSNLKTQEEHLKDAMLRYQSGIATLQSTLHQLQSADVEGGLDMLAVLGHYQGSAAQHCSKIAASQQLRVEDLVDEILFHVHRRDCDMSALVAQVSHLEAAVASKTSDVSELQGKMQMQHSSISRVKQQLQWCMRECEVLKKQLADKDQQIARLKGADVDRNGDVSNSLVHHSFTTAVW